MNLLYIMQKELYAAWHEATCPLFQEGSENDYFYTELFNYYHSLKGKTIDTSSGESLFSAITDNVHSIKGEHLHISKAQGQKLEACLNS
ncbi:MAG: hypothetical protein EPN17_00500 [Methylobacter sp.]|nr:MAG: hypothetical protein EPN17_00500 [Methylobacter sp.]